MPTNTLYGASNPVAGNSSAPTNNWWQGTQFDQGGKFYAPTYSENTAGEANALSAYNNTSVNQYGQRSMSDPTGVKQWMTQPGDQSFINTYGVGGRAGDALTIDPNNPNQATRGYEMTPEQRATTGLNNGRYNLTYHLDPNTKTWTADPNSMNMGETAQNVSNRVIAGRAGLTMAALVAGGAAASGMLGGGAAAAGAGAEGAGALGAAPAYMGVGSSAAAGGGIGATEYGLGTAALGGVGTGAEGAAEYAALGGGIQSAAPAYSYMGPGSPGAGATGEGATSPSWFDTAKNAYNTYSRGRQVVGLGQRLMGGGTQGGGTMPVNNQSGVSQPGVANAPGSSTDINWGDILGGAINGMGQANYGQNLRNPWQNNQNANAPYIQQLAQSYSDPNSYLKGPEFTAINNLYNNDITRKAAAGGTLGNDIDRQVKLQQFAMTNLGNYRTGLENVINNNQRNNAPYIPGNNVGLAAQAGALGAGTSAAGITNVGKGIYNIWDQLFGGKNTGNGGNSIPESTSLDPSVFGGGAPAAPAADVGQYAGDVGGGSDWSDLFGG